MNKPSSSSDESALYPFVALLVQFGMIYGLSWLGWWALQPIFPALSYPRFGVGMATLFLFLQGAFRTK